MSNILSKRSAQKCCFYLDTDNYNRISLLALYLQNKGYKSKYNRPVTISSLINEAVSEYLEANKVTVDHIYDMIESKVPFPQIFSGEL